MAIEFLNTFLSWSIATLQLYKRSRVLGASWWSQFRVLFLSLSLSLSISSHATPSVCECVCVSVTSWPAPSPNSVRICEAKDVAPWRTEMKTFTRDLRRRRRSHVTGVGSRMHVKYCNGKLRHTASVGGHRRGPSCRQKDSFHTSIYIEPVDWPVRVPFQYLCNYTSRNKWVMR